MELMALSGSRADWPYLRHFDPMSLGAPECIGDAAARAEGLLRAHAPSLLLVCGDRWEIAAACTVAVYLGIPIAHLGAGETTLGSYDDQFRGAIEAMASIKFAMTWQAFHKLAGAGHLVGCTSVEPGPILPGNGEAIIIFHPQTRGASLDPRVRNAAIAAASDAGLRPVVLGANPDRGSDAFSGTARLDDFHARLRGASVIIGNSSAGIIEAPILGTPTVNVGRRQLGRPRAASIFDCEAEDGAIARALDHAIRFGKQKLDTPYWRPGSVEKIGSVCDDYIHR